MIKSRNNVLLFTLLLIVISNANVISKIDAVVLLKGSIKNLGQSVIVEIQFRDETGALVRSRSASDGTYQAVLKPGHKYQVLITDDNLSRYNFVYEIPNYDKYTQLEQDFQLNVASDLPKAVSEKPAKTKKTKTTKNKKGKIK